MRIFYKFMHFFHPTPLDIVEQYIASKLKGKHFDRVLDPCVGDGALLACLNHNFNTVTIVDIDPDRLNKFDDNIFVKYAGDFLNLQINQKFDLILCNPPFNNKAISGPSLEEKFLHKCLSLLNTNGYGIFILPSSIINGTKANKIRKNLIKDYTILSIDILPKNTFLKIESHFYIILLKNIKPTTDYNIETNLGNINSKLIAKNDYSSLNPLQLVNTLKYENFIKNLPTFKLSNSLVFRGNSEKSDSQVHTTNFSHFYCNQINFRNKNSEGKYIKKYDLVCKRVGRNCHNSFSIFLNNSQANISDCVIAISLNSNSYKNNLNLLFNIRLSILFGASYCFLIDGSGANYISLKKLKETKFIDFKGFLSKKDLKKFVHLIIKKDIKSLIHFEKKIKNKINLKMSL
ncbi:N-6 DNA methylase [Acinetobacter oleivorans]|uniref:N-6 DNA methylase n=1 Tax=Acinetobacter oleivorans TaxID=1148157 RepID=UPI003F7C12EE